MIQTTTDLAEAVASLPRLRCRGLNTRNEWSVGGDGEAALLELGSLSGIIDYSPNDQVVSVRAGTSLRDLQAALEPHKQCLPMVELTDGWSHRDLTGTVGGALSINLPHVLEGECGSWRDWVLGMTLVLADGTTAKSGSHAVKNVAGYDIHKLMIGARGTLAVVAEVILRTYPLKSLPTPNVRQTLGSGAVQAPCQWIQRVKRSDFAQATAIAGSFAGTDIPATSTIWRSLPEGIELSRFEGDWVLRSNCGLQNLTVTDGTALRYMKRTKAIFDPTGKLNPGAMGVF